MDNLEQMAYVEVSTKGNSDYNSGIFPMDGLGDASSITVGYLLVAATCAYVANRFDSRKQKIFPKVRVGT